ncbi:hypothetical protein CBL_20804 [Carabus blaptoides fortunei]
MEIIAEQHHDEDAEEKLIKDFEHKLSIDNKPPTTRSGRRDPAPTETDCYWKKSILSKVGTLFKFFMAEEFSTNRSWCCQYVWSFIDEYIRSVASLRLVSPSAVTHGVTHVTLTPGALRTPLATPLYQKNVTDEILKQTAQATQTQYKTPSWFELRYGRITASRAHEVAYCKKTSGTLVEYIMGTARVPDTTAMKRACLLEEYVREALEDNSTVNSTHRDF